MPTTHNELADLCSSWLQGCKSRITWTNMRMDLWGTARPDVISIQKSLHLRRTVPLVHEVKVSRADYLSDIRSGKWRKYLPVCQGFYFVAPSGMLRHAEIPPEAGLLEHRPGEQYFYNQFQVVKRARTNKEWQIPEELLMRFILGRWGTKPNAA